ncbi:DUF4261 domain-containing protein [Polyangium sp. 15x6]|uniref:DUF4261 domain-containing protein n=1 Tax=Polyangium sp. 15x6 TaxID=3042687 RepID=UPI00249B97ED|nr:DUF4261 domain-containing protein [Polyangium sp. 15x6]MDI3288981.1 DUF4261 domain-containing protein [Polyangium sp. 15x6]
MSDTSDCKPGRAPYHVRLLYAEEREVNEVALQERLTQRLWGARVSPRDRHGVVGVHGPITLTIEGRAVPALSGITTKAIEPYAVGEYQQSWEWGWRAASAIGSHARFAIDFGELTSMMLATPDRVRLLLESIASLVEAQPPLAIHWCTTGKFEEPGAFLAKLAGADRVRRAINVRLFELPDGELVMDTLGLCALGMLDLQVHFKDLDLEEVGHYLYDTAVEHIAAGPRVHVPCACPVGDGDTITGPGGRAAIGRYEMAMIAPRRGVLDIAAL